MLPIEFKPRNPTDFIGQTSLIASLLTNRCKVMRPHEHASLKVLLYGEPGVGKSEIAMMAARVLVSGQNADVCIEKHNGRGVNLARVQDWAKNWRSTLWDGWIVHVIDEVDLVTKEAQDALLTLLDDMPGRRAFIGTSNQDLEQLTPRFQTRLQQFEVERPTDSEVAEFLRKHWGQSLDATEISQIAEGANGNVRAALLDAQTAFDLKAIETEPANKEQEILL